RRPPASSRRAPAEAHMPEFGAGRDPQLREDLAQVVVDRARAEEELCPDLAVGQAVGGEARDLQLLRSELAERRRVPLACGLAAPAQLHAGPLLPGNCTTELLERLDGGAQMDASIDAPPLTPQPLAVEQLDPTTPEGSERADTLER